MTTRHLQYPPTPGLGDKESATPQKPKLGACDVGRFAVAILRYTPLTLTRTGSGVHKLVGPWLLDAERREI